MTRDARRPGRVIARSLALVVAGSAVLLAQQAAPRRQAPPRDTRTVTGTAIVRGRVVDGASGLPIRRAIVRASAETLPEGRISSTDPEGRYEFRDLPAGRYTLTVSKGAYVTISYGQRRPNERGKLVDVATGQVLERMDFNLPRGAVISGRLYDEFGEAMAGARVQAMRYRYVNGERRLQGSSRAMPTDDRGEFRLFGLSPGEYVITAQLLPSFGGTNDERSSYAPTYYPGTTTAAEAQRITLTVGQEASASFALLIVPTAIVRGLAMSSKGRPLTSGGVFLEPEARETEGMFGPGSGGRIESDGSFTIRNVAPGSYTLQVRASDDDDDTAEFASVPIIVGGEDVSGLVVRTGPGSTASGRIVFEPAPPPNVSARSVRVEAQATRMTRGGSGRSRVNDDWTFELSGLTGERLIRVDDAPTGWYLKSVQQYGRDITDTTIDFSRGDRLDGLRIVLSQVVTEVSGGVTDSTGKPTREYVAVLFAEDSLRWRPPTRFVAAGRPDQDGRFEVRGLPPGRYLAVAVDYLETGEEQDMNFLQQMQGLATPILLGEGGSAGLALKLMSRTF